jgi:hypothetical protein
VTTGVADHVVQRSNSSSSNSRYNVGKCTFKIPGFKLRMDTLIYRIIWNW